jgi:arginyl-tRNA synthetase
MTLRQQLNSLFEAAFEKAGIDKRHAVVVESGRPDLCQFQCNGALAAAKAAKANPRVLAEAVLAALEGKEGFKELSLAGPGFINLSLSDAWLGEQARRIQGDARLGVPPASPVQKIIVDFGGPNVAKPMHVGHLRSTILGDALQRLHRFAGHQVVSDVHLGDWGTQMGMLIEEVRLKDPKLPYFDEAFQGDYPAVSPVTLEDLEVLYPRAAARCKADEAELEKARLALRDLQLGRRGYRALWEHFVSVSVKALKEDFGALGVRFDLWLGESHDQPSIPAMIEDLKARGIAVLSEGATVIMMDREKTPPLLLVKSDGAYLYSTTDLSTLRRRVAQDKGERILYLADQRQALHFSQVFEGAVKSGYLAGARAEHVAFGTVNGKDGKPFKTRAGGVMKLRDLIEMATAEAAKRMEENEIAGELSVEERAEVAQKVGMAAIKYSDLANPRTSDYIFDLEKFTQFEGKTGPYLLYAAVRVKSVLRKAAERGLKPGALLPPGDAERALYLKVAALPDALERAAAESLPHLLCDYAYDLAGLFSTFYQSSNILREEDPARQASWLALSELALRILERVLGILGMETPEKM